MFKLKRFMTEMKVWGCFVVKGAATSDGVHQVHWARETVFLRRTHNLRKCMSGDHRDRTLRIETAVQSKTL